MINRQKLQSFIDSYKDKFIKELDETCKDILDTNDTNLIDLDQEYDIPQCDYIKSEPMIHLDVDKLVLDIDNKKIILTINNCPHKTNILKSFKTKCRNHYNIFESRSGSETFLKRNFPININLTKGEYIIKLYFILEDVIYITNYSRIISRQKIICKNVSIIGDYIIDNNNYVTYIISDGVFNISDNIKFELIPQPELNYKMPKIFIDVIDAFHTQNTDLMQSCCKKYLDILNKTKNIDKIIEKDKIIKNLQEQLLEKDKEIERLKLEMEEIQKFYINS
jgi:hypothetical protein